MKELWVNVKDQHKAYVEKKALGLVTFTQSLLAEHLGLKI